MPRKPYALKGQIKKIHLSLSFYALTKPTRHNGLDNRLCQVDSLRNQCGLLPDPKSHITAQVVAQASERIGVANGAAKLVGKESVVEIQTGE